MIPVIPDKIYLGIQDLSSGYVYNLSLDNNGEQEYIRKDAIRNFIFKMIDALNDRHLLDAAIHCALNGIIEELDSL